MRHLEIRKCCRTLKSCSVLLGWSRVRGYHSTWRQKGQITFCDLKGRVRWKGWPERSQALWSEYIHQEANYHRGRQEQLLPSQERMLLFIDAAQQMERRQIRPFVKSNTGETHILNVNTYQLNGPIHGSTALVFTCVYEKWDITYKFLLVYVDRKANISVLFFYAVFFILYGYIDAYICIFKYVIFLRFCS